MLGIMLRYVLFRVFRGLSYALFRVFNGTRAAAASAASRPTVPMRWP